MNANSKSVENGEEDFEITLGDNIPEIEDGTYPATLVALRPFEIEDPDKPGEQRKLLSWEWVTDDGVTVEGVSSMATSPSPSSGAGSRRSGAPRPWSTA